jgi:hypothetical protein
MNTRFKRLSGLVRSGCSDNSFRGKFDSFLRVRRFVVSRALGGRKHPWLGPFIRAVWPFRTIRKREIVLHYAPEIWHEVAPEILLLHWADELKGLERKFAFRLPRVQVFLFSAVGGIRELFGPEYGGLALPAQNAIVVADHSNTHEDVRHELVQSLPTDGIAMRRRSSPRDWRCMSSSVGAVSQLRR